MGADCGPPHALQRMENGPSTTAQARFTAMREALRESLQKLTSSTRSSSAGSRSFTSLTSSYLVCSFLAWCCSLTSCLLRVRDDP